MEPTNNITIASENNYFFPIHEEDNQFNFETCTIKNLTRDDIDDIYRLINVWKIENLNLEGYHTIKNIYKKEKNETKLHSFIYQCVKTNNQELLPEALKDYNSLKQKYNFLSHTIRLCGEEPSYILNKCKFLIESGEDVNLVDKYNNTPLEYAFDYSCDNSLITLLLLSGCIVYKKF